MPPQTYAVVAPTQVALPPPPGVIPTFDDPFSLRPYHNVAASLGMLFTGIFMIARLYTKIRIIKRFNWEDYTCMIGFAFFCGWIAIKFKISHAGAGTHQWNISSQELSDQRQFSNYGDMLYSVTACFTKLSIILLVLRIFCPHRDGFFWILQALNVLNTSFYICYLVIPILACRPRLKIWQTDSPGKCINIYVLYIFSSVFNALSDIAMLAVPIWQIWNLAISRSRKLGISAIFLSGSLAIAASLARLYFCVILTHSADYSYVKEQASLWTLCELSLGLICSCLFVLPRLYRHLASIPPYRSPEYDHYQQRKGSGGLKGWYEQHEQDRAERMRKGSEQRLNLRTLGSDKDEGFAGTGGCELGKGRGLRSMWHDSQDPGTDNPKTLEMIRYS